VAAAALLEAKERDRVLSPDQFDEAYVSEKFVRDHKRGHEEERIRDYLLDLFLRQLDTSERNELIFCAVPRSLDVAIVRATLQLPSDLDARKRCDRYARFTFTTMVERERLASVSLSPTLGLFVSPYGKLSLKMQVDIAQNQTVEILKRRSGPTNSKAEYCHSRRVECCVPCQ
jgi:hypothetical protein